MTAGARANRRTFTLALLSSTALSACDKLGFSDKEKSSKSKSSDDEDDDKKKSKKAKSSAEPSAASTATPAAAPVKYTSAAGRYEIMFPVKPTEKNVGEDPVNHQANANPDPKKGYTSQYADYAKDFAGQPNELVEKAKKNGLEGTCGGVTKKMGGSNERRKPVTVEGQEGCEVEFYTKEFGVMRMRTFWVGTRNYTLITSGVTAAVDSDAFFASFKATK